ncbi:hypothetical protein [Reyranella sp.]|uniref:hypothetical protein n=1 Tax=Reyranella sp. TaxID=1929291 RepID=UPI00272EF7BF|nr:hypothetical protein [Reyranella sp.]MDP2376646.1 hypothetical protein [Reyranella sp.]
MRRSVLSLQLEVALKASEDAGLRPSDIDGVIPYVSGVLDNEMLMALPSEQFTQAIASMEAMAKNGFRYYPFPQHGIQQDVRAGMGVS